MAISTPTTAMIALRPLVMAASGLPLGAVFWVVAVRSPAAYCLGSFFPPPKIRRYHGTFGSATILASTMLAPHRRQNLRAGSLGSPHEPQIRSPGWATRWSTEATGRGLGATSSVGLRATGSSVAVGVRA